jgi:hypothetical protein
MGLDLQSTPMESLIRKTYTAQETRTAERYGADVGGLMGLAARVGSARTNLALAGGNKRLARRGVFGSADIATLGETFRQAGLTKAETFRGLFGKQVGAGFQTSPRTQLRYHRQAWKRAGFKVHDEDAIMETGVLSLAEEGTDVSKNLFAVQALGQTVKMSMEDIQKYFPDFGEDLRERLEETTKGLDTVSGLKGFLTNRKSTERVEGRLREAQERMAMSKFSGMTSHVFGRRAQKFKGFGDLVRNLQYMQQGRGIGDRAAYEQMMDKLPDLRQFMEAASGDAKGVIDHTALMRYFGDDLTSILEQTTGMSPEDIKAKLEGSIEDQKSLFGKDTIQGLFRHVLNKQDIESIPLGSEMNANYMKFAKGQIETLSEAIGKAVANAIKSK